MKLPLFPSQQARRDNAIRNVALNTASYRNARRILMQEFGYTEADLLRAARSYRKLQELRQARKASGR